MTWLDWMGQELPRRSHRSSRSCRSCPRKCLDPDLQIEIVGHAGHANLADGVASLCDMTRLRAMVFDTRSCRKNCVMCRVSPVDCSSQAVTEEPSPLNSIT